MLARYLPAIRRGIMLLAVWACAMVVCAKATEMIVEHSRKSAEVAQLEVQYNSKIQEYAGLLAEEEKINTDPSKQVDILKENYGYTLPDETPIVIVIEQSGEK